MATQPTTESGKAGSPRAHRQPLAVANAKWKRIMRSLSRFKIGFVMMYLRKSIPLA
ncbi:hypothetical protein [Granulicella paludicola]|uniref:hypothetical protein n=1 Tax=Granulicella paludicola TaxID=474951 RepID=UPI0021E005B9|nr:hypothetical protein [Granulicella paludicola]